MSQQMTSDDIFDRYSRDANRASSASASGDDDIFSRYERKVEAEAAAPEGKKRLYVSPAKPRGDVADMSGFNNRMASSVPILGPLFDKATAAAGATIQPLFVKPKDVSDIVSGKERPGSQPNWYDRYQANLAMQEGRNELYGEEHPIAATAADLTGATMLLGPISRTALGARMMGLRGNSLGARVYQGAAGMGALETTNQLLRGNNPLDQGFLGPVPLAIAGGAVGPMAGEAISSGATKIMQWLPRRTGELAGVNSVGRNMLVNALEGETPASVAEATYAALLEALNRHRGKGQQKVIVEHVHVHAGGQAVVGVVESPGGGVLEEREGQPHALGHAESASVRREDQKRQILPVAGHG